MNNPWDKIFAEDFETALRIADDNYRTTDNKFDLRARALIRLYQTDYLEALSDFKLLNEKEKTNNTVSDDTYLYIGLCYYALDILNEAKEYFEYPVRNQKEFKYTTDISLPSAILYFYSLKTNDQKAFSYAEKDLKRRKTPVAEFLTKKINESEFESQFIIKELRNRQECRLEFYKAIRALENSDNNGYIHHLEKSVGLKGQYLEFEYYLSKIELERLNRN